MPIFDVKCTVCEHIDTDKFLSKWDDKSECSVCGGPSANLPALIRWAGDPSFTTAEFEYNGKIVERKRIPRPEKPKDKAITRGEHG